MKLRNFVVTSSILTLFATAALSEARYSPLLCLANAQAIALDHGAQELNKQVAENLNRELANDFHRFLLKTAAQLSEASNQDDLELYHRRVNDYRNDSYNTQFERVGYCIYTYIVE
jgi:hypothetical protein